jgi:methionyl-tRNA synthetase
MKKKKAERWQCAACQELYETEEEANDCRQPEKVEGWICGECEEFYEDEEEAEECCK